jgi:hypothetical protein
LLQIGIAFTKALQEGLVIKIILLIVTEISYQSWKILLPGDSSQCSSALFTKNALIKKGMIVKLFEESLGSNISSSGKISLLRSTK